MRRKGLVFTDRDGWHAWREGDPIPSAGILPPLQPGGPREYHGGGFKHPKRPDDKAPSSF